MATSYRLYEGVIQSFIQTIRSKTDLTSESLNHFLNSFVRFSQERLNLESFTQSIHSETKTVVCASLGDSETILVGKANVRRSGNIVS